MSNSAFDLIGSLKGDLEEEFPKKKSNAKNHEVSPQTLTFMIGGEEHTFPYTQIRHMNRTKKRILVAAYSANITVNGKELEQLYSQLRRYKVSTITESDSEEKDQIFIESISVTYNNEEDKHE